MVCPTTLRVGHRCRPNDCLIHMDHFVIPKLLSGIEPLFRPYEGRVIIQYTKGAYFSGIDSPTGFEPALFTVLQTVAFGHSATERKCHHPKLLQRPTMDFVFNLDAVTELAVGFEPTVGLRRLLTRQVLSTTKGHQHCTRCGHMLLWFK